MKLTSSNGCLVRIHYYVYQLAIYSAAVHVYMLASLYLYILVIHLKGLKELCYDHIHYDHITSGCLDYMSYHIILNIIHTIAILQNEFIL